MMVPSNYFVTKNIPDLFSFQFKLTKEEVDAGLQSAVDFFNKHLNFLNACAANADVSKFEDNSLIIIESMQLFEKRFNIGGYQELHVRINFVNYLLRKRYKWTESKERSEYLKRAIDIIRSLPNKSDEMLWYYACALHFEAVEDSHFFNLKLIQETIACIEKIKSRSHKEAMFVFIIPGFNQ